MKAGERAVVIGASVGGLLAARVLADHYEEVFLLERDEFPPAGENRKGVPQGRHVHALLAAGREALERFFPGLSREIVELGGIRAGIESVRWFDNGGYHARCHGIEALLVTRPTLEARLRDRLTAFPNVRLFQNCVASPMAAGGSSRVGGVRAVLAQTTVSAEEAIPADLVVDASGRGSRTPAWLAEWGFPQPTEEVVPVSLGYSTRFYRRKPEHLNGDVASVTVPSPPGTRGGVIIRVEGDRWMLTLFGLLGDHPPTDDRGFQDFTRSLPAPEIFEVIADAEPLTEPLPFKFPASARRRYERLERFPEGYLVFGDAICSFNPVYGQGMSVAALEGAALERVLARGPAGLALRFFREAAKVLDTPWSIAVGGDLRYPGVEGERTTMGRLINWYLGKLHFAARRDPKLALAFQRVANLLTEPTSLLRPNVALRVLRGNLGKADSRRARTAADHAHAG